MRVKAIIQIIAGAASLLALLVYTWWHTGGLLARYIMPDYLGYVAAGGIEGAVVVLSLQIGTLRQQRKDAGWLISVLATLVVISALANIAEGYSTRYAADLTWQTIGGVDILQAVFGVAATGLISLIVFSLAEIVGQDVNAILSAGPAVSPSEIASQPAGTALTDAQARLISYYQRNPKASQSEAASHVGKSRQWVGQQLRSQQALAGHSRVHNNGHKSG